ncbi:hypothetical protein [Streptomyces beigongshangae]|uniref:hypothetical protein n=1 Tax=Streptomyces beigongshangae TaxID=2841597 RepID=UPI001C861019|nr:hypothetical protein [Streptomyces sp. REN17]
MGLSVDVYVPRAEGGTEVRGSEPVRSLGARFLPRPAVEDLTVAPDEVPAPIAGCAEHAEDVRRRLDKDVPAVV